MRRHGLTLIEVLLALVLVMALGAIVLPSLVDSLHERAFESAADVTNEQLMLARAHAQATGEAVEVTYNADTKQVEARLFTPWLNDAPVARLQPGTSPLAHVPAVAAFGEMDEDESESARPIAEPWATRALASGIKMASKPPAANAGSSEWLNEGRPGSGEMLAAAPDEFSEFAGDEEEFWPTEDIRLAVFMPDGSALLGEPVWLGDDEGRWGMISINPWSGLPFFQRLSEMAASANAEEEVANDGESGETDDPALYLDDGSPGAARAYDDGR